MAKLVVFLCLFLILKLINSQVCSKTNCDIDRKIDGVQLNVGQWFSEVKGELKDMEKKLYDKIEENNQNIQAMRQQMLIMKSEILRAIQNPSTQSTTAQVATSSTSTTTSAPPTTTTTATIPATTATETTPSTTSTSTPVPSTTTTTTTTQTAPSSISTMNPISGIDDCSDRAEFLGVATLKTGERILCRNGWTSVMHMRVTDKVSANRNWISYEGGFGDLKTSFWAGLKKITDIMARKSSWQLRYIGVNKFSPYQTVNGSYKIVTIDRTANYRLHVEQFTGPQKYSVLDCDLRNSENNNNQHFSTEDRDSSKHCPDVWGAGFWFNACYTLGHHDYTKGHVGRAIECSTQYPRMYYLSTLQIDIKPN